MRSSKSCTLGPSQRRAASNDAYHTHPRAGSQDKARLYARPAQAKPATASRQDRRQRRPLPPLTATARLQSRRARYAARNNQGPSTAPILLANGLERTQAQRPCVRFPQQRRANPEESYVRPRRSWRPPRTARAECPAGWPGKSVCGRCPSNVHNDAGGPPPSCTARPSQSRHPRFIRPSVDDAAPRSEGSEPPPPLPVACWADGTR